MREIKFRGKTHDGKWLIGNLNTIATGECYIRTMAHDTRFGCGTMVIPETF